MNKKALFFDLDGTLWDVSYITLESAKIVSNKYNLECPTYESIVGGMGQTISYCAKLYYPNIDVKRGVELLNEIAVIVVNKIKNKEAKIYPYIEETLLRLENKYDLFIISNTASKDYASAIKNYMNVNFKETLACGSINLDKSEGIKYIMNKYSIKDAIYIGDTRLDKTSAKQANIPFIYCKYGFGKMGSSEYEINNFSELENVIEKIK